MAQNLPKGCTGSRLFARTKRPPTPRHSNQQVQGEHEAPEGGAVVEASTSCRGEDLEGTVVFIGKRGAGNLRPSQVMRRGR